MDEVPVKKKRKWLRRLFFTMAALFVAFALLFAIAQSTPAKRRMASLLSATNVRYRSTAARRASISTCGGFAECSAMRPARAEHGTAVAPLQRVAGQ